MEKKRVRVEFFEEQVDLLLRLLEDNEQSEEDIIAMDAWYFSKLKLNKAKNRFKSTFH
jgi:hypothetical protein